MNEGHVDLVERMVKRAKDLVAKKNLGPYKMGFHCVPSLAQVKLTIIYMEGLIWSQTEVYFKLFL